MADIDWLRRCYKVATNSPDPSTQNGAVLVNPWFDYECASGWNGPPKGVSMRTGNEKYFYVQHAEAAAILDAAKRGVCTLGLTLYTTWAACHECAKTIIDSGIARVVTHRLPQHERGDWKQSVQRGLEMLVEAGVIVSFVDGPVNAGVTIRFKGEPIEV